MTHIEKTQMWLLKNYFKIEINPFAPTAISHESSNFTRGEIEHFCKQNAKKSRNRYISLIFYAREVWLVLFFLFLHEFYCGMFKNIQKYYYYIYILRYMPMNDKFFIYTLTLLDIAKKRIKLQS